MSVWSDRTQMTDERLNPPKSSFTEKPSPAWVIAHKSCLPGALCGAPIGVFFPKHVSAACITMGRGFVNILLR